MDLPYTAEYAKSNRSNCRGCKSGIDQGSLRLAVMVQSPVYDGKVPNWYHFSCFFGKQRPKSVVDIKNFEGLRLDDQTKIREKINVVSVIVPDAKGKGKGKKRDAGAAAAKKAALADFKIEYSKSSRATCRGCEQKIMKGEIRIAKKDFTTEIGMKYGGQDLWHHLACFAKMRCELCYFDTAASLPGFKSLKKDDQKDALEQIPAIKQEEMPPEKKIKLEEESAPKMTPEEEKIYINQNKTLYNFRDELKINLKKEELIELLQFNKQAVPPGVDEPLNRLADIMTFGALEPCTVCKKGQLVFNGHTYACEGSLTEWTRCTAVCAEPTRTKFLIPKELKDKFPFLKKYKYIKRTRVIRKDEAPSAVVKKVKDEHDGPKVQRERPPLYDMEFIIHGKPERGKDELKTQITKLGGKVVTKISRNVMAVIAHPSDVEAMNKRMEQIKEEDIHVVSEDFVDEAKENAGKIPELVIQKSICDWGSDPHTRLPPEPSKSDAMKSKSKSIYTKSVPSKVKLTVKGGLAVDPDSGLEDIAHVYVDAQRDEKYSVVLGLTDIQAGKNSYYKLQVLESDSNNTYWLFRSWGRIGTTIGGHKVDRKPSLHHALRAFQEYYEKETGNEWCNRGNFKKMPGKKYPIDIDYNHDQPADEANLDIVDAPSKLAQPVQDLMRMIFDVKEMKRVMAEMELDTEKMPLGKLSNAQIQLAYGVLSELQQLVDKSEPNRALFIDASNRFYTIIPHSFGVEEPPVIEDADAVKQKLDMLDSLGELEIAYNLMKDSGGEHSVDNYYKTLKTEIEVLERDTNEFRLIEEYVKNTHADTHRSYDLIIEEVFKVKRQGEDKRFKPFRKLHNHKLLWHGSRTTNYAGILSQGLRIAPPEAPCTGYMFGKGIYFADMVSKSANYCFTNPQSPKGLLMLCDVALGDMYERDRADYITKLPKGKHSTKGLGVTEPDPAAAKVLEGIEVPLGKGLQKNISTSLLYNEYIVYDVAQVNIKYLLKLDFRYKY